MDKRCIIAARERSAIGRGHNWRRLPTGNFALKQPPQETPARQSRAGVFFETLAVEKGFGPARWAARLSPAARLPESNPAKQQLARHKRYQPRREKFPRLRSGAHSAGAGLMPLGLSRRVLLLPLSGSVCCCWLSGPDFFGAVGSGRKNLAAHRCSHLF